MREGKANRYNLVFPNEVGGFVDRNDFMKRVFKPLLRKRRASIGVTFHSLRHAGNSLLAQAGAWLKVLQQRLGHSTASTTLSVYTLTRRPATARPPRLRGSVRSWQVG